MACWGSTPAEPRTVELPVGRLDSPCGGPPDRPSSLPSPVPGAYGAQPCRSSSFVPARSPCQRCLSPPWARSFQRSTCCPREKQANVGGRAGSGQRDRLSEADGRRTAPPGRPVRRASVPWSAALPGRVGAKHVLESDRAVPFFPDPLQALPGHGPAEHLPHAPPEIGPCIDRLGNLGAGGVRKCQASGHSRGGSPVHRDPLEFHEGEKLKPPLPRGKGPTP
jgi:hypothetical protein